MAEKKRDSGDTARDDEIWARRLAFYGLDIKDAAQEPVVASEGEAIRLYPRVGGDGRFDSRLKQVAVSTLSDLKRMIGTPDEVIRLHGCYCPDIPSESVPPGFKSVDDLEPEQQRALYAASKAYLHGDSTRIAHHLPALEHAYELDRRRVIGILVLQDLTVERGATVTLGGSMNVALFRHIVIKHNGRLRIDKSMKIDCVSIKGEGAFASQVFDRVRASDVVIKAGRA